jgi:hypothetical protein
MRSQKALRIIIAAGLVTWLCAPPIEGNGYVAYSLNAAKHMLTEKENPPSDLFLLGGITRPVAIVYDEERQDLILVGERSEGQPVSLDDFVVALRALMKVGEEPLVSIELDDRSQTQSVEFKGGIEDTTFGRDLLEADVVLKKLALGILSAGIWGIRSYFDLSAEDWQKTGHPKPVTSKFWFLPNKQISIVDVKRGVGVVKGFSLIVKTQNISSASETSSDEFAEEFALAVSAHLSEIMLYYPQLARLDPLFRMTALAETVQVWEKKFQLHIPNLDFWKDTYPIKRVPTPRTYPVINRKAERYTEERIKEMRIQGGIQLKALILNLKDGSPFALKEIVIKTRPEGNPLTWELPILDKLLREADSLVPDTELMNMLGEFPGFRDVGMCLKRTYSTPGSSTPEIAFPRTFQHQSFREESYYSFAPQNIPFLPPSSNRLGGVLLRGVAEIAGEDGTSITLTPQSFSLVVEGQNARLDPRLFRKFVTALWCVYYSDQDPGISIDPIGPKVDKHLVRYIGRVVNTDLGRVMREADYTMKKWAVGTERPDYPGFQPVDGWMRHYGPVAIGISRRFWFVPENIRFRRGGDLLLFDSGRMRLLTEYNADGLRGQASPADQRFADFFTQHYQALAEKYPIYKELFEYAQLVALAKYLKQNGVPLHWFLMAHKDLVLTEDSPGTVDQLAKASDYFEGLQIQGGVNLAVEAQYVMDAEAVAALQKAWAAQGGSSSEGGSGGQRTTGTSPADTGSARPAFALSRPVSFAVHGRDYTVLPQGTASTGKDHRGLRYQTDLALRRHGKPALELVRYYNPRRQGPGLFGQGWDLLIPYRVAPANEKRRPFLNAIIPEQMVVENLLSGQKEVLTFSTDRYSIAGYVPEKISESQVVGLFLLSDGSFRLADKLGNQFHFDPAGRLTGMYFSPKPEDRIEWEYVNQFTSSFVRVPYRVRPADEEMVDFLNARLPKRVRITDQIHQTSEVLVFDPEASPVGYVPEKKTESRYRLLALRSDGSLQLVDRHGNQVRFTRSWDFESFLPSPDRPVVRSVQMAGQKVQFAYTLHPDGQMVIALAKLSQIGPQQSETPIATLRYEYDPEGRLCGTFRRSGAGSAHTLQAGRLPPSADAASVSAPDASAPAF